MFVDVEPSDEILDKRIAEIDFVIHVHIPNEFSKERMLGFLKRQIDLYRKENTCHYIHYYPNNQGEYKRTFVVGFIEGLDVSEFKLIKK